MRNHEWVKTGLGASFLTRQVREKTCWLWSWRLGWITLTVALPMRSNLWGIRLGIKLHVSSEFAWDSTQTTSCLFWGAWVFKINDPEVMLKSHLKNRETERTVLTYTIYTISAIHVYIVYIYIHMYVYIYVCMYVCIYIYVCTVYTRNILELMLRIPIVDRKIAPWWRQSQPRPRRFTHGVSPRKMIYGYPVSSMLGTTPAWHTFHSCYMILYLRFYENRCKFPKDSWCNSHQCTLYIYISYMYNDIKSIWIIWNRI